MGELHTGPKHPLNVADPEPYLDLHVVLPGCQPKGEGDCGYLAQYNQAYSYGKGSLALVGCPPMRVVLRQLTYV